MEPLSTIPEANAPAGCTTGSKGSPVLHQQAGGDLSNGGGWKAVTSQDGR